MKDNISVFSLLICFQYCCGGCDMIFVFESLYALQSVSIWKVML